MSRRFTFGLSAFLGVQGATKLYQRKEDRETFALLGMPAWMCNFAGVWQTGAAVCILIPPLRPIGVLGSAAAAGGLAGAALNTPTEKYNRILQLQPIPTSGDVDKRLVPLVLMALQLLATEVVAARSGQRPFWMVAGLCGGFLGGYEGWRIVPEQVGQCMDFDLPALANELVQGEAQKKQ
eukprot:TRINITY_DN14489_c0_g1_i2.p2 TRINITY_DN14489_c0_g1~~TRINITY_DN14489_c0_g1_i2.p2  ORF type:complete len:207 (+),score=76.79 TRINITY_DN14489_c0_g1_i2:82-621(+)